MLRATTSVSISSGPFGSEILAAFNAGPPKRAFNDFLTQIPGRGHDVAGRH